MYQQFLQGRNLTHLVIRLENQKLDIYQYLRQQYTLTEIAQMFNTSVQTISKINQGLIYNHENVNYPLSETQKYSSHLRLSDIQIIVDALKNTKENFTSIARKTKCDRHTIVKINNGQRYVQCLKTLGYNQFPIRKQS